MSGSCDDERKMATEGSYQEQALHAAYLAATVIFGTL